MNKTIEELRAKVERCLGGVVDKDVVGTVLFSFDRACGLAHEDGRQGGLRIAIDRLVNHRNKCVGVDVSSEIVALHEHIYDGYPVLIVYPDQDTAKAASRDRISLMNRQCEKHSRYNGQRMITQGGSCLNCSREKRAKKADPLFKNLQTCQGCGKKGHEGKGTIILCIDKANNEKFLCCDCAA